MNPFTASSVTVVLSAQILVGLAQAHSLSEHAEQPVPVRQDNAQVRFADVQLTNEQGNSVNLKRDLVDDRIVVMGFIYTSCTTVCPVVSSIMANVQKQLGSRVGTEVQLVSITVDPLRDNPQRLLDYAGKFQKGAGWSWLTGSPQAISETLKGLGAWAADPQSHSPLIMVGDGRSPDWTRFYGFPDPTLLVERVEQLRAERAGKPGQRALVGLEQRP